MAIIKDRDLLNEDGSIPIKLLVKCIEQHKTIISDRYEKLNKYYDGEHKILTRTLSSDLLPNNKIDEDSHNNEIALDMSINGIGYELLCMNDEEVPYPELAVSSPLNSFLVVDSTVKHKPMFGVTYYEKRDIDDRVDGYNVNIYTDKNIQHYFFTDLTRLSPEVKEPGTLL